MHMLFARVPRVQRAAALCVLAAALLFALLALPPLPAGAASPGAAQGGATRASGIHMPLALAGFAMLSSGLLLLGKSRIGRRPGIPALLAPARSADAPPPVPRPLPPAPSALAPLAAVAGALHATASALDAIAPGLSGPASGDVAASAGRVREAQITLARWLEDQR